MIEGWRGGGGGLIIVSWIQAGSRKKTQIYSPANIHAVFSVYMVEICTRLLGALAKTPPVVCVCVCVFFCFPDFCVSSFFLEKWITLAQILSSKDPGYGRGVPFWAFYFSG